MGLFEQFPYANFHEMNLDWLLQQMKALGLHVDDLETYINNDIDARIVQRIQDLLKTVRIPLYPQYVVAIGDSYLEGWTPDGTNESWGPKLARYLNLTVGTNFHIAAQGGSGFVATSGDRNFITMLSETAQRSGVDPDAVDLVIAAGGFNDASSSENSIMSAISTFCTQCRSIYPNAKILIADMMWSQYNVDGRGTVFGKMNVMGAYGRGAAESGAMIFANCWRALAGPTTVTLASDGVHPNAAGQNLLAEALAQFIYQGSYTAVDYFKPIVNDRFYVSADTEYAKFIGHPGTFNVTAYANKTTGTLNGQAATGIWFTLPTISGMSPVSDLKNIGTANVLIASDEGYFVAPCMVSFVGGCIEIMPVQVNAANSNYQDITNLSNATVQDIALTVPMIYT